MTDREQTALAAALARAGAPDALGMVAGREGVRTVIRHGAAREDSVWRLFSMTKLVAAIAALKLAEAGRLDLTAPVADYVPAFADLMVIDGFDAAADANGAPRLRPPARQATVDELMSHRTGLAYTAWSETALRYRRAARLGRHDPNSRAGLADDALVFDPGAGWAYGPGIDWLGAVIEAASGEPVDTWCAREIFAPLGIDGLRFELDDAARARLLPVWARRGGVYERMEIGQPARPELYAMGEALWGEAPAYLRLLQMLLNAGEGVLSPASVDALFAPRTGAVGKVTSHVAGASADMDFFPGLPKTFAYGGLRLGADAPGGRRAGSLSWAGILNTHFWVDRQSGLAAVLMLQHLPFVDDAAMAALAAFERAVYADFA